MCCSWDNKQVWPCVEIFCRASVSKVKNKNISILVYHSQAAAVLIALCCLYSRYQRWYVYNKSPDSSLHESNQWQCKHLHPIGTSKHFISRKSGITLQIWIVVVILLHRFIVTKVTSFLICTIVKKENNTCPLVQGVPPVSLKGN